MLTRRTFLKALALGAAGLALPLDAAEALVAPARRLWALDGTMLGLRASGYDRMIWGTTLSDLRGGMGEYPWFDVGPPNVARVPLWAEYTVYGDGTVVGPTPVLTSVAPGATILSVVNRQATP